MEVRSTDRKAIHAKKRSNGDKVTYICGDCDIINKRYCSSPRKEDCGEYDTKKKNCGARPCPLWSSWSYTHTDADKNSVCWNDSSNEQHYCYTDSNRRASGDPKQFGTKTKFRDCQGEVYSSLSKRFCMTKN